jgi:sulfur carrier protein ThiS
MANYTFTITIPEAKKQDFLNAWTLEYDNYLTTVEGTPLTKAQFAEKNIKDKIKSQTVKLHKVYEAQNNPETFDPEIT